MLAEASHDSEGRVWVEVGSEGLRLRVTHLHPANPSVSEALKRKCAERREAQKEGKDNSFLTGKLIYPPEDDKVYIFYLIIKHTHTHVGFDEQFCKNWHFMHK